MNYIKQLDCATGFVRLQVTDQMPASSFSTNQGNLCLRFLHSILAELSGAGGYGLLNRFDRMGLAYGDQSNLLGPAAGPQCGRCDSLAYAIKTLTEVFLRLQFWIHFNNRIEGQL
jgi:hypothetical protein